MKPLHIGTSPISNRIYAGHTNAAGNAFLSGKQDVTGMACGAVAEHVLANGEPVTVTCNGNPAFIITVERINGEKEA